jgi:hypothetical protein
MRIFILILVALSGCSSPAVHCDEHLRAINAPAPKQVVEAVPGSAP